ncbi:MAG: exodeoxyribonuclease VII small subunit [Xanthomonadales bacterium]|nr:exodeoxyribonuclease VII small subunit [Xanthomonadales bacterium]
MSEETKSLPDFEKSLAELEKLVEQLESGELSLDESLDQFKRGVQLTRECQQVLEHAQLTVEKLLGDDEPLKSEPFNPDD